MPCGGGREKESRSVQSTASDRVPFLNSSGMLASSRPSQALQATCDDLLEASVPQTFTGASSSLAVDWTDLESFSRPPPRGTSD